MITLLVMTDGRQDCIRQTIAGANAYLDGPITSRVIHDDSADPDYHEWLCRHYSPDFTVVSPLARQGFGGAIRSAWRYLASEPAPFVFHLEDDFVIERTVDLTAMIQVLTLNAHLAQLALRRQPWNDAERRAGGVVELHPEDYIDVSAGGQNWLEHRLFFSTNPSLYPRSLIERGWPTGEQSEGVFSAELFADPGIRCGYWGGRDSGEWCVHIGATRTGVGY